MNLVWLIALTTALHAEPKHTDGCAEFLGTHASPTFEIDVMSSLDLEIEKVLMPALGSHLRTSLGRTRLRFLLHHPFLDRATIVDRQSAVGLLADDTHYRRKLREALGEVEAAMGGLFEFHMSALERDHRDAGWAWANSVWPTVWGGAWGSAGAAIATGMAHPSVAFFLFVGNFMSAMPGNLPAQERARKSIHPFKPAFKMAARLAEGLSARESEALARIGHVFSALESEEHELELAATNRRIKRLSGGLGTLFGSFSFLSNRATHETRRALLDHATEVAFLFAMIGELDVLVGLADYYDVHREHLILPTILPEDHPTHLSISAGHHPYVWSKNREASVHNEVGLSQNGKLPRFLLLTGPNTGGKSTYLKMIGTNVLLAQIGAPVSAADMKLTPLALFTNKHVREALDESESSFSAQCRRVADILGRAESERHVLILADEILTGTSPEEHTAIERAIIRDLVDSRYLGLLATHDRKLQSLEATMTNVRNVHVVEGKFSVHEGPSLVRNALQVLRDAGVKASIVEDAQRYLDENHPEI